MNILLKTVALSAMIISCHFFGPVDRNIQTKNVNFTKEDITDIWKLDKFSYQYLSGKEDFDSIYITFNSDSTFEMNNSFELFKIKNDSIAAHDFSIGKTPAFSNGKTDNILTNNHWDILKTEKLKTIELKGNESISLNVYKKDSIYQLWYFFGDPDAGERLRFLK
jgi:hypothetical protein